MTSLRGKWIRKVARLGDHVIRWRNPKDDSSSSHVDLLKYNVYKYEIENSGQTVPVFVHEDWTIDDSRQWQTQCSCCGISYAIYRVTVAMFWLAVLSVSLITEPSWLELRWLVYLTNWGLLVLTVDVNLQGVIAVQALVKRQKKQNTTSPIKMTTPLKMQWVISNIALGIGFIITVGAMVVYYSADVEPDFVNVNTHVVNSIYLFCNLFITAMPLRVYHALHVISFGAVYIIFSIILKYTAGVSAYRAIDWSDPRDASLTALGCLIGGVVFWLILYGLYRVRLAIAKAGVTNKSTVQPSGVENSK